MVNEQLTKIKAHSDQVQPDSSWVSANRIALMQYMRGTAAMKEVRRTRLSDMAGIFMPAQLLSTAKAGVSIFLVGMLAVGGWIASVSASQDSLPGEVLYNVKLAAEKTELIVASVIGSEKEQATANLKHAAVKVEEFHKAKSSAQAAASIQSLKEKIESANKSLTQAQTKSPEKAVAVAKLVGEKTEEILSALADAKNGDGINKEVTAVENLIEQTGVNAVAVLLDKKTEVTDATNLAVKQNIEHKVDRLVSDLARLDTEINATAMPVIGVASTTITSTVNVIGIVNPTGGTVSTTAEQALQKVQAAEQTVQEANKIGETKAAEVKILIEQNDLINAVKKVQELGDVKQQAKEVVTNAQVAVQGAQNAVSATVSSTQSVSVPAVVTSGQAVSGTASDQVIK